MVNYFAISAPAGTPGAVVNALNAAINKIVQLPDVVARFKLDAVEAISSSVGRIGAA